MLTAQELPKIVRGLLALPTETEWVEFKLNRAEPNDIGEYISALSNSAALHHQLVAFIVWGVENETHRILGTSFRPREAKVAGEELENYLARKLNPRINFRVHEVVLDELTLVVFEIPAASHQPVAFDGERYIRVGSYTKSLTDFPEKERDLWAIFSETSFEQGIAKASVSVEEVSTLIDCAAYHELVKQMMPTDTEGLLERLVAEQLILPAGHDVYSITNMGAILFARRQQAFDGLDRKSVRVIVYKGSSRVETIREQVGVRGYAVGFQSLIGYINNLLPANEEIREALRHSVPIYPDIAIRELVANALVHQDFNITGTGPMIEIFQDRIEITNPGIPLIDTQRFIDAPPRSRNDSLAALMRRVGICEERGSGIDKVIFHVEVYQLPPPDFEVTDRHTRATIFAPRKLAQMTKTERIRACYQHACLLHVSNKVMTNTTLRKRLGISNNNYPMASQIIAETQKAGLIRRPAGDTKSRRHARYVPYWA